MEIETLYRCIDKYLEGEATELETNRIDRWYESFDCRPGFTEEEKCDITKKGEFIFFQLSDVTVMEKVSLVSNQWN